MPTFLATARARPCAGGSLSHDHPGQPTGSRYLFDIARRGSILAFAICGACHAAIAQESRQGSPQEPMPVPNYKELIHGAVKAAFTDPSSVGLVEISRLHPTRGPQIGDWMACLRVAIDGEPTLYAAFIDSQPPLVILLRRAVRFDDCTQDQYEPIARPPAVQDRPPGAPRKK